MLRFFKLQKSRPKPISFPLVPSQVPSLQILNNLPVSNVSKFLVRCRVSTFSTWSLCHQTDLVRQHTMGHPDLSAWNRQQLAVVPRCRRIMGQSAAKFDWKSRGSAVALTVSCLKTHICYVERHTTHTPPPPPPLSLSFTSTSTTDLSITWSIL